MRLDKVERPKIFVATLLAVTTGVLLAGVSCYLFPETNSGFPLSISVQDQIPWDYLLLGLTMLFAVGTIVAVIALRNVKLSESASR